jgi:hypothetical protein
MINIVRELCENDECVRSAADVELDDFKLLCQ